MPITTDSIDDVFATLTEKQRETLVLLGEGRTSKEIAHALGISESATIQRIETIRAKAGGMLRKDLARAWREYSATEESSEETCKEITGNIFHLPPEDTWHQHRGQDHFKDELHLADAMPFQASAPWAEDKEPEVVPEALNGPNAVLMRSFMALGIALGMLVVMLVLLSVANELGELI